MVEPSRRHTPIRLLRRRVSDQLMTWAWQKANTVPTIWWWGCQKRSQHQLRAQAGHHPSLVCQDIWTVQKRLFWGQSAWESAEICRPVSQVWLTKRQCQNKNSQTGYWPGKRVCSPQKVRAKTYVSVPDHCVIKPLDVSREGLKFYPWTSFFLFFINPPCSAAAQWMAIKCISEVRS